MTNSAALSLMLKTVAGADSAPVLLVQEWQTVVPQPLEFVQKIQWAAYKKKTHRQTLFKEEH